MNQTAAITSKLFGTTPAGETITEYTLTNARGSRMCVINFGGIITQLWVANSKGELEDVVLGFETLDPYLEQSPFFGALIGRVGNRIAKGRFSLDGVEYQMAINNGVNHLHGGVQGFDKKAWTATPFDSEQGPGLVLHLISEDGDQGYPGNLDVTVTYVLSHSDEIIVDYRAHTDKATPVNLTQHSYFNLAAKGDILNHRLQIFADHFNAVDETQIPLGEFTPVAGTPFDFRQPHLIGERINQDDVQLKRGLGYDHNYVINQLAYKALTLAARVEEDSSGRVLEVYTQEPGVQFYSGNFLDGSLTGKGVNYQQRSGFCLEPQHHPDSVNQAQFPSVILRPGEQYQTHTIFKFSVK